jgi:hypothetical protein
MSITFGFILIFVMVSLILLPIDDLIKRNFFPNQLFAIFIFSFLTILLGLYLSRDLIPFNQFSFTMDLVVFCLSGFGLVNTIDTIVKSRRKLELSR